MRVPDFLYAQDIHNNITQKKGKDGYWYIPKSYGYRGLFLKRRLYLAYCVFIGKYDVVFYEEDREKMKTFIFKRK